MFHALESDRSPFVRLIQVAVLGVALLPLGALQADTHSNLTFIPQALQQASSEFAPLLPKHAALLPSAPPGTGVFDTDSMIAAYRRNIETIETNAGAYAPALAEQLLALARLYQVQQQHSEALTELGKARHIARANAGLDTPAQFPAIEASITSHLALDQFQDALELQKVLVALNRSHYGKNAAETVPRLITLGDMYYAAYRRGLDGDSGVVLEPGDESQFADPNALSPEDIAFLCLRLAQRNYLESITILIERQDWLNPQLLSLEANVIETLFLQAHRHQVDIDADFFMSADRHQRIDAKRRQDLRAKQQPYYEFGEQAFQRILSYLDHDPATKPEQIGNVLLQLGDWHFVFGREALSHRLYAKARDYLKRNAVPADVIESLVNPAVPVQLPASIAQPHSVAALPAGTRTDLDIDGYIDVSFTLNRNGAAQDIEILQRSAALDPEIESRLLRVLRNAPFRPRLTAESEVDGRAVKVRYNYALR